MRLLAITVTALAVAPCATGAAPRVAALPSPTAPLSAAPPVGGGATAAAEGVRHRVDARTSVVVSVDRAGSPFAVTATQRLIVHQVGDYYFTIGAPLTDVEAAPGSAGTPGLRTDSILWEGFNPGRRELAARATLDAPRVTSALPLRITVSGGSVVVRNATGITAGGFTADALKPQLVTYLDALRRAEERGTTPAGASALVTTQPVPKRVTVEAPLQVTGKVGGRAVDTVLGGGRPLEAQFPAGAIDLSVRPLHDVPRVSSALPARKLLEVAVRASLVSARARQYDTFLGNPDPSGYDRTVYRYVSRARPAPPVAVTPSTQHGWSALRVALWCAAGLALLAAAVALWARS